ncbi:MAG: hypothetical protein V1655_03410 [bacterium]
MQNLQTIYTQIKEKQKESKEIKKIYREALANSQAHKEISEEIKTLKEKKKGLEDAIKLDFEKEFERLDILKADIESDKILLNDIALTQLMNGETVEITDEYNTKYEPVFSVSFKKAD